MSVVHILCIVGLLTVGAIRLKPKIRKTNKQPTISCGTDQDEPNRHVVFYGGTFDPPTVAHLAVASESLNAEVEGEHVNCVWFSPIYHPGYKPNKAYHKIREEMLSMSFGKDSEKMKVSLAYEESYFIGMDKQSMDYNALVWLGKQYPQTKFSMVVGADSLTPEGPYTIEGWRDILWNIERANSHILVLDRECDSSIKKYQNMLLLFWQVSKSPFVDVCADMSAFSKMSSSGIRNLLLATTDGKIDEELRGKLGKAGLPEPLVEYLATRPELVQEYSGEMSWKKSGGAFTPEYKPIEEPTEPDVIFSDSPEDSSFCSPDRDQSDRHVVLYGGTFDPPTVAHLKVASESLKSGIGGINCVWFSPIYHPEYKPNKARSGLREEMISLSFSDVEKMKVSQAYERSYYDGMDIQRMDYNAYRWLARNYRQTKFSMVVGADSLTPEGPYTLEGWRDILQSVARANSYILVLDRDTDSEVTAYQDMLLKQWNVSPSPFTPIFVDMSAFSKVSSSGIRKLMLDAPNGHIGNDLFNRMVEAGLSEDLVGFLAVRPTLVRKYAGQVGWLYSNKTHLLEQASQYHKSFME